MPLPSLNPRPSFNVFDVFIKNSLRSFKILKPNFELIASSFFFLFDLLYCIRTYTHAHTHTHFCMCHHHHHHEQRVTKQQSTFTRQYIQFYINNMDPCMELFIHFISFNQQLTMRVCVCITGGFCYKIYFIERHTIAYVDICVCVAMNGK